MSTYTDHTDRAGLDQRLRVLTSREERARMLAVLNERDFGCVTMTMSRHELAARLREAYRRNLATRLIREMMAERRAQP